MVLIDTSFYISLSFEHDANHKKAQKIIPYLKDKVTTEDILKETLTLISQRKGKKASIRFYNYLLEDTEIFPVESKHFELGLQIFLDPKLNKNISVVDCTTASICKEKGILKIVTFDSHFKSFSLKTTP